MTDHKPRQFNRYKLNTVARVRKNGAKDWTDVRVDTVSPMGAGFENKAAFLVNDNIEFFMPNPNQGAPPFHLSGKVVWVKEHLVGIEFTGALA